MRLLMLLILLAFPVMEIWLLIDLGHRYGWWLGLYLILVTYLGWRLIQEEKQLFAGRMMQTLMQSPSPNLAILGGLKNLLAGVLLVIPGVMTDVIAVFLLLIPTAKPMQGNPFQNHASSSSTNDDVIEGEYTREDEKF
jgi:UPF0716 protein FxsA